MSFPLVSLITVNYRQPAVTCELLRSVKRNTYGNVELILVDNAPLEDHSGDYKKAFPNVKIVTSENNLGFAGGNNLGIANAKGAYLFFINNDTELTDGLIEELLKVFQNEKTGVAAPKIRYYQQPQIIQYAGFTELNLLTARNRTIGDGEVDQGQHDTAREIPYAHGAAMMASREVVEKVGGLPEIYFLYYEELDWCLQIRRAGYKIYFQPSAVIYHKESVSVGRISPLKTYYLTRSRLLFMRRNARWWQLVVFLLFLAFLTIPKWTLTWLLLRDVKQLKSFYLGIVRGITVPSRK